MTSLTMRQRQRAHPRQRVHRLDRRRLRQRDRALGDVGGVVADAFEVAADLQRGENLAQVARHRLAQRQQPDRQIVELALELVDLGVAFDDAGGERAVALGDRIDRRGELAFGEPAHLDDHVVEPAQLLVVAFDDVFGWHRDLPLAEAAGDVVFGPLLARIGEDALGLVELDRVRRDT